MKRVRYFAFLLSFAIIVSMFVGCAGGKKTSSSVALKKGITITMCASQAWVQTQDRALADKFATKSGNKIDFQVTPDAQYTAVLKTKLNAGQAPDIYVCSSGLDMVSYGNPEKYAVDLSDQEWVKRMDKDWLASATLKGKVWAQTILNGGQQWVFTYNNEIFTRLGLTAPKTYEQFKSVCAAIKNAGIIPIYEDVADNWHHSLPLVEVGASFEAQQPGLYNKLNTNKIKYTEIPGFIKTTEQIAEFVKLGYYGNNYLTNQYAGAAQGLIDGKYAMFFGNTSYARTVKKDFPNSNADKWGMFICPFNDNQILGINPAGASKFINKASNNINEAKDYLNFLAEHDNLQYWLDNHATGASSVTFPEIQTKYTDQQKAFYDSIKDNKKGVVMESGVNYFASLWPDYGNDLTSVFLGKMTAQQYAANIDTMRAKLATVQGDPNWSK